MANIYRVIQIKSNQLLKRYHNDKHFSEFYLQDGGKNQLA